MSKKVIGILGGMGPLATADLFQKITLHTVAACDQAHPRVCIDSNTDIADRTAALLHGGEDPVPEMIKSAKRLESIGADFLIVPCNTAHNYYEAVSYKHLRAHETGRHIVSRLLIDTKKRQ